MQVNKRVNVFIEVGNLAEIGFKKTGQSQRNQKDHEIAQVFIFLFHLTVSVCVFDNAV